VQNIVQVCQDDSFTISLPIFFEDTTVDIQTSDFIDFGYNAWVRCLDAVVKTKPPEFKSVRKSTYKNPSIYDILFETKSLRFYKEDYFNADLNRVCEMEELVSEWYDLSIRSAAEREDTLKSFGFLDLCNHRDDFDTIIGHFYFKHNNLDSQGKDRNLELVTLEVGG
jgi:hypothetical protein